MAVTEEQGVALALRRVEMMPRLDVNRRTNDAWLCARLFPEFRQSMIEGFVDGSGFPGRDANSGRFRDVEGRVQSYVEGFCASAGLHGSRRRALGARIILELARRYRQIADCADVQLDALQGRRGGDEEARALLLDIPAMQAFVFGRRWREEAHALGLAVSRRFHPDARVGVPGSAREAAVIGSWLAQHQRLCDEGYLVAGEIGTTDPIDVFGEQSGEDVPGFAFYQLTEGSVLYMLGCAGIEEEAIREALVLDARRCAWQSVVDLGQKACAGSRTVARERLEQARAQCRSAGSAVWQALAAREARFELRGARRMCSTLDPRGPETAPGDDLRSQAVSSRALGRASSKEMEAYLAVVHPEFAAELRERITAHAGPTRSRGASPSATATWEHHG